MENTPVITRTVIKFENIPGDLQLLPHWALYSDRKVPIKISAVARGWPEPGWNHGLTGEAAKAGAKSNDPSTWGTFFDCQRIWRAAQERQARPIVRNALIVGPAFALTEELGLTVIDQDDPVAKVDQARWEGGKLSADDKARKIADAQRNQDIVLKMFASCYIERSISGKGFHVFVKGKLPHMRYQFSFYGSVFGCCQFINMTGDVMR